MAEKIIQLEESEYEELVKTSKLRKKQVLEEARKLWETRGIARLSIAIDTKRDLGYNLTFDCTAFFADQDERFPISYNLRQRLSDFIRKQIQREVDDYYGEPTKIINEYNKRRKSLDKWFRFVWLVAVCGWVVAAILAIGG